MRRDSLFVKSAWFGILVRLVLILPLPAYAFDAPSNPALSGGATHAATGTVEVAFSPWQDGEALILRHLAAARQEVYVQAYILTSKNIAQGLLEAKERGVRVAVLVDGPNASGHDSSQVPRLAQAGIPVMLETRYGAAHNKVIILDPELSTCAVITGSYNFTQSARVRNAENLLVLKGDRALAQSYLANWKRHRADARPWSMTETSSRSRRAPKAAERQPLAFPWER